MADKHKRTARPRLACEVMPGRVIAARRSDDGTRVDVTASRRLPDGAVTPSLAAANLPSREAVREAVASALSAVVTRGRDVALVIPDSAVRVSLMDFDSLPERESEAVPLIRFRLRKALPFDVERAAISHHVWRSSGAVRALAVVAPLPVVEEYESVVREAGFLPGVVMPSVLAALGLVEADVPTMTVKLDDGLTTIAIVDADELRLLRVIEHPGSVMEIAELANNVYPSLVFYEDTYQAPVRRVLVGGSARVQDMAGLEEQIQLRVEELMPVSLVGDNVGGDSAPRNMLAGVTGALLG